MEPGVPRHAGARHEQPFFRLLPEPKQPERGRAAANVDRGVDDEIVAEH